MNIIKARQAERIEKIKTIEKSIKASVEPDLKKLIMLCCYEWGISERSAKEYLRIALASIENERNKGSIEADPK